MRRTTISLGLAAVLLTGCGKVNPITVPVPEDVTKATTAMAEAARSNTPDSYVRVGFALVESQCHAFFDVLDKAQDQATYARRELTLAGGAAAGILAALKAGIVPITVTGIAVPFVVDSIGAYNDVILFTPYPDETGALVKDALSTYRENIKQQPADIYDAVRLVQNYAAICTYSGIHQLAKQALAKASTTDQGPNKDKEKGKEKGPATGGAAPPPPPRGFAAPPPPRGFAAPPPPSPPPVAAPSMAPPLPAPYAPQMHIPNVVVH